MVLFFAIFSLLSSNLPIQKEGEWKPLTFDNVSPNTVSFGEAGISIEVANSASPVLHLFPTPKVVQSISARGSISGSLNFPDPTNWESAPDDALLRIGIIEKGDRKLSMLQKLSAPNWILELDKLLGEGATGVDSIQCFHVLPREDWIGKSRVNPNVDLFTEKVAASPLPDGTFSFEETLEAPVIAYGIWILADGDDTESEFSVSITEIGLHLEGK